jgi:hypothetical protein
MLDDMVLSPIFSSGINNATSYTRIGESYPTANRIRISVTFSDKSRTLETDLPPNGSVVAPFAPPPSMPIGVVWPTISTSYIVQSYTYRWWNSTTALTAPATVYVSSNSYEVSLSGLTAPAGATRLTLSLRFTNGASIPNMDIPYPSTEPTWKRYPVVDSPY